MYKARFRIDRSRAFSCPAFMIAVTAALVAQGQTRDCDELPEADRQLCRMMRACAAIDDPERRRECFRAVAEAGPTASSDEEVAESEDQRPTNEPATALAPVEPSAPLVDGESAERAAPESTVTNPAERAAVGEEAGGKRTWSSRIRSIPVVGRLVPGGRTEKQSKDARPSATDSDVRPIDDEKLETIAVAGASAESTSTESVIGTSKAYEVLNIPERFVATVSAIHDPGRNRRLVALDDRLLFVSDRGGEGRLRVGDEVRVQKATGLFGEKYRITGPARRPFTARRIRCEHPDLNEDNRRRCQLLSR